MIDYPFFFKPIPSQKDYTKTLISLATDKPSSFHHQKRQERPTGSVVHVTITTAGTVVYTQTETSYSLIPSYSPVSPPVNTGNNNLSTTQEGPNLGAIIGGAVGGIAGVLLIGLAFFLLRRSNSKRKRQLRKNELIVDNDSYYQGHHRHTSSATAFDATTANSIAPRQLVAPLKHLGNERESKYYQHDGGYYEDRAIPLNQKAYYSGNNSMTSDSLPSTAVDTNSRQVPNEVDYPVVYATHAEERHVPHLKDGTMVEPPHTRDFL